MSDRVYTQDEVDKLVAEAYDRGRAEGLAAQDPEAIYGRMLAEEESHRIPKPIWG